MMALKEPVWEQTQASPQAVTEAPGATFEVCIVMGAWRTCTRLVLGDDSRGRE